MPIGNISEFPSIPLLFLPSSFPADRSIDPCATCADDPDRRHMWRGQLACQSRYGGVHSFSMGGGSEGRGRDEAIWSL